MSRQAVIERLLAAFDDGGFIEELRRRVAIPTESQVAGSLPALYRYLNDEIGPELARMGYDVQVIDNPVEGGGPFHRRRQVEQLAQLPRPQGRVLVVALREERVQPGVGDRRGGREEGDVVAAGDQAVGEHGGDGFDRTGPFGGDRLRDRADEGDAEAAALGEGTPCTGGHAQALSRNGGRTLDASKHSCAMSDARRAWVR